jgi:hypothetical protein
VREGSRAVWALGDVAVMDGGDDLFATQGIFVP